MSKENRTGLARAFWLLLGAVGAAPLSADELPEYRLKAEYIYRFAQYTEWPAEIGNTLNLCVVGPDPFGAALDNLQGKPVNSRSIVVLRNVRAQALEQCQIIFIASASIPDIAQVLGMTNGRPALLVADAAGAARQGVILNMAVVAGHVTFEANLQAARAARLSLSSRLLRLATRVIP